jgi:hypothetical protein
MRLRKNLGLAIESLELRAAPCSLLDTGIPLEPVGSGPLSASKIAAPNDGAEAEGFTLNAKGNHGWDSRSGSQGQDNLAGKPKAIFDAIFAGQSRLDKGRTDGSGPAARPSAVNQDTAEVRNFPTGDVVIEDASSTLRRTPNGISWTFKTSELQAKHAYTLWVVVFNYPENCVNGCGLDDLGRQDVAATLAYGGGHVVGRTGEATFSGHLQEGDTSGFPNDSPFAGVVGGEHVGLVDSRLADVHLVVRDHGVVIPQRLAEQLHTFSGTCNVNACANVQFAAHVP